MFRVSEELDKRKEKSRNDKFRLLGLQSGKEESEKDQNFGTSCIPSGFPCWLMLSTAFGIRHQRTRSMAKETKQAEANDRD